MVKMVKLKSSDGEEFDVSETVVMLSETLKNTVSENSSSTTTIPLPDINSKTLSVVINYLKKHTEEDEATNEDALIAFDNELVDELEPEQPLLFDTIMAADSLKIKGLLDITCKKVADMIRGKTPEEIRQTFNLKNDFTPEEEEEVRRENAWHFE